MIRLSIIINEQPEVDNIVNVRLLSIAGGEHEKPTADFGERIKYNTARRKT